MNSNEDGYELFRRAVEQRDADAWAEIAERYRPLLIAWVGRCQAAEAAGEHWENLADEALARAWAALSPERFASFPNVAAVLAYLRACVGTTVIDAARSRLAYERLMQSGDVDSEGSIEHLVLEQFGRAELWQIVSTLAMTEAERLALNERFVLDLPPRVIQARHPTLFPNVMAVYLAVRNVCDRLRRNKALRLLYEEQRAA